MINRMIIKGKPVASTMALMVLMSVPAYAMAMGIATNSRHHTNFNFLLGSSPFFSTLVMVEDNVKEVASKVVAKK